METGNPYLLYSDQCNEKLIKDLPPNIPTSHLNPEELSKFIDQGLDLTLFFTPFWLQ